MLLTTLIVAVCHCLTVVAQQTPATLEVIQNNNAKAVVPGYIYLTPSGIPFSGPYVFALNGVSHHFAWVADPGIRSRLMANLVSRPLFSTVLVSSQEPSMTSNHASIRRNNDSAHGKAARLMATEVAKL